MRKKGGGGGGDEDSCVCIDHFKCTRHVWSKLLCCVLEIIGKTFGGFWIGLNDLQEEGKFHWLDSLDKVGDLSKHRAWWPMVILKRFRTIYGISYSLYASLSSSCFLPLILFLYRFVLVLVLLPFLLFCSSFYCSSFSSCFCSYSCSCSSYSPAFFLFLFHLLPSLLIAPFILKH